MGFQVGTSFPASVMPANKVCLVDVMDPDAKMVLSNKKCILNYHDIDCPGDVDTNGIFKDAQSQINNE
jgi:hypothetical protein